MLKERCCKNPNWEPYWKNDFLKVPDILCKECFTKWDKICAENQVSPCGYRIDKHYKRILNGSTN